jgi:hypothetical protein
MIWFEHLLILDDLMLENKPTPPPIQPPDTNPL